MKTLFMLMTVTCAISLTVNAQTDAMAKASQEKVLKKEIKKDRVTLRKLEGTEVSSRAKEAFKVDFPAGSGATWKRDGAYDQVFFTQQGQSMTGYYDSDAKLVGTVTDKKFEDLPAAAQSAINKKYAGYAKGAVIFYDDNEFNDTDMILYGTQFEDEDNYFAEVSRDGKTIVLRVTTQGAVSTFATLK